MRKTDNSKKYSPEQIDHRNKIHVAQQIIREYAKYRRTTTLNVLRTLERKYSGTPSPIEENTTPEELADMLKALTTADFNQHQLPIGFVVDRHKRLI